jgi:hypothetical protein
MITRKTYASIYNGKKVTFAELQKKKGIYFIISKRSGNVFYVGYSGSDVYKTALRHFQSWGDRTQIRITYKPENFKITFFVFPSGTSEKTIYRYERILIRSIKPKDNPMKYETPIYSPADSKRGILMEIKKLEEMKNEKTFGASLGIKAINERIQELKKEMEDTPTKKIIAPF